ncbi:CoA-dependent propionaldehyde dehydrogenase [Escherichia coli]|nr:CoA-dependent propionaldehyde dehydrogenase [Escherichia coli]SQL84471.1 propanediol utilization protein PduP [Escherichia coli]
MNNSELETLIRNILREQLVPATHERKETLFSRLLMKRSAQHTRPFYAFNSVRLKPVAPLSAPFAKN